jgi:hypothetical protein
MTIDTDNDVLRLRAVQLQLEARTLYGREISVDRARELIAELTRYEQAITSLAQTQDLEDEPGSFLEVLVRLAADPDA